MFHVNRLWTSLTLFIDIDHALWSKVIYDLYVFVMTSIKTKMAAMELFNMYAIDTPCKTKMAAIVI